MSATRGASGRYLGFARWFGHVVLVLIVANLVLWGVFSLRDRWRRESTRARYLAPYSAPPVAAVYPGLTSDEIAELFAETWNRVVVYAPYVQYREAPFAGTYVNVHDAGFRLSSAQHPWPPSSDETSVFFFGGSTMFGYGVGDEDTIASHLSRIVTHAGRPVSVYNFGAGGYYSTQERILFERLVTRGHRPTVAIFLDGLNDFVSPEDEPIHTDALERLFPGARGGVPEILRFLPMMRLARGLRNRLGEYEPPEPAATATANSIVDRYLRTIDVTRATCEQFGTRCLFVWQPIPIYRYDLSYHPFVGPGLDWYGRAETGYEEMARRHRDGATGEGFLWLADMQRDLREPLYVDTVHYSSAMSRRIAVLLADAVEAALTASAVGALSPASR